MAEKVSKKVEKKEDIKIANKELKELILPVVSEKSYADANNLNKYHFYVHKDLNKIEVGKAVEQIYGVKVKGVNVTIKPGKLHTIWSHNKKYRRSDVKKAIVTLKEGDKIDEFFNI